MSKVVVATFLNLDGVMEEHDGAEGFEHSDRQLPFFYDDMGRYMVEQPV